MPSQHMCYWILAQDPESGKPFLIFGSDKSEDDARAHGVEMLSGVDFTVKPLRTRNLAMASSIIRGKRLENTHDLQSAKQRLGHEKSIARLRQRVNRRRRVTGNDY